MDIGQFISSKLNDFVSMVQAKAQPLENAIGNEAQALPGQIGQGVQMAGNFIGSQPISNPLNPNQRTPFTIGQAYNAVGGPDMAQATKETAQAWGRVPGQTLQYFQGKPITPNPALSPSAQSGLQNIQAMTMGGPSKIQAPAVARGTEDVLNKTDQLTQESLANARLQPGGLEAGFVKPPVANAGLYDAGKAISQGM